MSLVGPRPALAWEAEMFRPPYDERLLVLPGMTGCGRLAAGTG